MYWARKVTGLAYDPQFGWENQRGVRGRRRECTKDIQNMGAAKSQMTSSMQIFKVCGRSLPVRAGVCRVAAARLQKIDEGFRVGSQCCVGLGLLLSLLLLLCSEMLWCDLRMPLHAP
jgi:hypothetical protein